MIFCINTNIVSPMHMISNTISTGRRRLELLSEVSMCHSDWLMRNLQINYCSKQTITYYCAVTCIVSTLQFVTDVLDRVERGWMYFHGWGKMGGVKLMFESWKVGFWTSSGFSCTTLGGWGSRGCGWVGLKRVGWLVLASEADRLRMKNH